MTTSPLVTPQAIRDMKGREAIPALTVYDFAMCRLLDDQGVPLLLVGDSLGMVVLGHPDTTLVTLADMEHHTRAAARARPRGLLVADLPAGSYDTAAMAVASARTLMAAGARAVKAEGGHEIGPQVHAIIGDGIPFLGHLGMLPQHVREEGGYRIKGKSHLEHEALVEDALFLEEAGAFAVVLELVTARVSREITRRLRIPTIGIASGHDCDGQILVTTDLWGTTPGFIPRHVESSQSIPAEMRSCIRSWMQTVRRPQDRPTSPTPRPTPLHPDE